MDTSVSSIIIKHGFLQATRVRRDVLNVVGESRADWLLRPVPSYSLHAARKLVTNRRENRWSDLHYKKRALGTAYRSSPTGGSSHAKGIVLEKVRAQSIFRRIGKARRMVHLHARLGKNAKIGWHW